MKKLYEKSELAFALVWIGLYVVLMNLALRFCGGLDDPAGKTPEQLLVPVLCGLLLAAATTVWIVKNGLGKKYGLCRFRGSGKGWLWFVPLILMSCINLKNGLTMPASAAVSVLLAVNLMAAGYVEELIFRGFLFRAMEKDRLSTAVIVSAVTFGVGHIVNLANTADTLGVLLQVCYAIAVGFLYTVTVYRGGSLWPCVASHMFVNGTSVFAAEQSPLLQTVDAVLIMLLSGGYAVWLWKRARTPIDP